MRREDWSVPALLAEAVCMILEVIYIGLQVYYGMVYHVAVYKFVMNIVVALLVYVALFLLAMYPERVNRLPSAVCEGDIRRLSIRMVRVIKLIFVVGLMVPCVCDVAGIVIQEAYSLIIMGLMLAAAVYYEVRILQILRKNRDK